VEALAPGASVARRHGLNANLVFKWIRRSREGWRDRRCEPANEKPVVVAPPKGGAPAFIPVKLRVARGLSASAFRCRSEAGSSDAPRRGAMEISLPNGAKVARR
jgi:transposase